MEENNDNHSKEEVVKEVSEPVKTSPVEETVEVTEEETSSAGTNVPKDWREAISDVGLRDDPSVRKHASVEALAKSYVELSKKLGAKGLAPLPEDATPEVIEARKAIKRGAKIKSFEDYSRKLSDEEKAEFGDSFNADGISKALFDAGCDDETHSAVMEQFIGAEKAKREQFAKEMIACDNLLKDEWNEDFDIQMKANEIFVSKNFPEVHELLVKNGGYHAPALAKMFKRMGELSRDGEVRIQKAAAMTFDEELKKIEESDAYRNPWSNGHNEAVNRRTDIIMKMAQKGVRQ